MSACKQCGADVVWIRKSADGPWQCFNADGVTVHWDACSQRRWQQVKSTGERFETKRASGYSNSVHGTKFDMQRAKPSRGTHFKPSGECKDCVAPWEVCVACPDQIRVGE